MMGGGTKVGVHSISETCDMPAFCFLATTRGNWTFHAVEPTDGMPQRGKLAQIDVGGKWDTKFQNTSTTPTDVYYAGPTNTTIEKKTSRSIGISGFGKTMELKKTADDRDANASGMLLQGLEISAAPPEEVKVSGKAITRFTTKECQWLSVPTGTLVAEMVLSLPPEMSTNTTPMEEINFNLIEFLNWMQKPVGLRLSCSLSPEDSQLLMAVIAPSAPCLLQGCELTLDSNSQLRKHSETRMSL